MVEIGKYNTLKIVKDLDFGVYLDGGNRIIDRENHLAADRKSVV